MQTPHKKKWKKKVQDSPPNMCYRNIKKLLFKHISLSYLGIRSFLSLPVVAYSCLLIVTMVSLLTTASRSQERWERTGRTTFFRESSLSTVSKRQSVCCDYFSLDTRPNKYSKLVLALYARIWEWFCSWKHKKTKCLCKFAVVWGSVTF